MNTLKVFNKTKSKWIKFQMETKDLRTLWNLLAKYGYGFVLYGDESEDEDHGYENCEHERVVETEITMCHDCVHKSKNVEWRNNPSAIMCELLHTWVEPTDFCAWGVRNDTDNGMRNP